MISVVRAAPKSGFLGVRLGCGDIHALKRCFIHTISLSLYSSILVKKPWHFSMCSVPVVVTPMRYRSPNGPGLMQPS